MNRIKISPLAFSELSKEEFSDSRSTAAASEFQNVNWGRSGCSSVFMPMHYEKNYRYPLIIWLHSDGNAFDENDQRDGQASNAGGSAIEIHKLMPMISMRNYVAIAPEGNFGDSETGGSVWSQDACSIEDTHRSVADSVEMAMTRFNVNPDRIFIGGCGSGGTMAFRIGMERPNLFAGVMSINGPMPEQLTPLASWEDCRNMPVFWTQGRQSTCFDSATLCRQLRLLHVAGFALTLRQYPGQAAMSEKHLQDANRWMMEIVNAPGQSSQRSAK